MRFLQTGREAVPGDATVTQDLEEQGLPCSRSTQGGEPSPGLASHVADRPQSDVAPPHLHSRYTGASGEDHERYPSLDPQPVVPLGEPSVFVGLTTGTEFWLGPIPEMPRNLEFIAGLGGRAPRDCFILPVKVRDKTVCFLYFDNIDESVSGLPMADFRRLAAKASLAFQVYLLKSKIRTL